MPIAQPDIGGQHRPHRRFVGRLALTTALPKFLLGGASRASPTIIPYGSLHSVSSILSLALRLRGDRAIVRTLASVTALDLLRRAVLGLGTDPEQPW